MTKVPILTETFHWPSQPILSLELMTTMLPVVGAIVALVSASRQSRLGRSQGNFRRCARKRQFPTGRGVVMPAHAQFGGINTREHHVDTMCNHLGTMADRRGV